MPHKRRAETPSSSLHKKLYKSVSLYKPLQLDRQEIRLLIVEPGTQASLLQCSFESCFLDENPSAYETISYVWGDATRRTTIFLHGQELNVPASSAEVLHRMRLEDQPRKLWLDAVCINQDDLLEKAQQVAAMGQIYSKCTRNLVWLGEDDGSACQAISCIKEIVGEMHTDVRGTKLRDTLYPDSTITSSDTGLRTRVRGSALRRFYNSEWFSRVWVVQEAALAPQSICFRGDHEIGLIEVLQAALWVRYKASEGAAAERLGRTDWWYAFSLADWILDDGYHLCRPLQGRALTALLASFRASKAQDPRDHVFALSGLWLAKSGANTLPPELIPDYLAELPDVLRRATRFSIKERGDLEILKLLCEPAQTLQVPSWVHRWDLPTQTRDPIEFVHHGHRSDAGIAADVETLLRHEHILTARGFTIGAIAAHLPELQSKQLKSFRSFLTAVERLVKERMEDANDEIIGVTLQAGNKVTSIAATEQESGDAYKIYKRALFNHESAYPYHNANLAKTSAVEQKRIASQFALSMTNACYNRKFFTTTSGHFGLGPRHVQDGDLIVILYGSPFPVMLRPKLGELDGYEIVGVCYVYGIMRGEAVNVHKRAGNADMLYRLF